jgi:hypothetical protein
MEQWKELLVYWQAKHVDDRPPRRQDIDPVVDLPRLAANLLIADVVPEGYRYRLVGSAVVERHNEEMTGKLAGSSKFTQRVRPQLLENFDAVRDEQMPRLLKTGVNASSGHAAAVTIVLPLVANTGETEKLLVGVFYDRRFDAIDQIDYLDMSRPTI